MDEEKKRAAQAEQDHANFANAVAMRNSAQSQLDFLIERKTRELAGLRALRQDVWFEKLSPEADEMLWSLFIRQLP